MESFDHGDGSTDATLRLNILSTEADLTGA
jgi:hypothetical protein